MAHSARQNDSFGKAKWAVLKCKMGHSASAKNVKKIQVLCFQRFRKLSNFAYLRPQVFYFRTIDSQSTFFDFLSKHFRTVPSLVVSWDRPYPTPVTALFIPVAASLHRPHENKPISLISKYLVLFYFVELPLKKARFIGIFSDVKTFRDFVRTKNHNK